MLCSFVTSKVDRVFREWLFWSCAVEKCIGTWYKKISCRLDKFWALFLMPQFSLHDITLSRVTASHMEKMMGPLAASLATSWIVDSTIDVNPLFTNTSVPIHCWFQHLYRCYSRPLTMLTYSASYRCFLHSLRAWSSTFWCRGIQQCACLSNQSRTSSRSHWEICLAVKMLKSRLSTSACCNKQETSLSMSTQQHGCLHTTHGVARNMR